MPAPTPLSSFPHFPASSASGPCLSVTRAKATYAFDGGSEEELPFAEGDTLDIVDTSDSNWWKTEKAGVIFIVPASYLEIIG